MAGHRKRAPKSWARVIETKAKLGRKGAPRAQIVAAVQEKYPEIIRAEKDDLVYLGLMTIVNGVCNLKGGSGSAVQPDFFAGYDIPTTIALREPDTTNGGMRNIEKNFDAITKAELRQFIADHPVARPKKSKRNSELMRFFDFIRDYGKDDWTVKECWKAAQAHTAAL